MVNFGPLAAEIGLPIWGTLANFNGFRVLAALLHGSQVVGVSQTAALNRGRHLCSTGRPSRWALAHIIVTSMFLFLSLSLSEQVTNNINNNWEVTEMGDRLATIDMRNIPSYTDMGELGPHLTQCGLGRGLRPYQVAS